METTGDVAATTPPGAHDLPEGTVTFLFTDLEGSTRLLEAHPAVYREAVRRHHALLRGAVEAQGGAVFETVGDAVYAAFARPSAAAAAALAGQLALHREDWGATGPLRVRMGVHLGEVERQGGHYFGAPLYRCARLMGTAHGGQVVLSGPAAALVRDTLAEGASLRDLGEHRLKDLAAPERVFQLGHPELPADFPPLRSLDTLPNNLPLQLTSFVGRARELAAVGEALAAHRLLTLTGPGGTGKTRLALQAAAEVGPAYPDGVWLVELATLADPALVPQAVAAAVGVREEPGRPLTATLADALRPKRTLLLLDNCEHLLDASARLADALLRACPDLRVLATSREALGIGGETAWLVPSLALPDPDRPPPPEALSRYEAVALFVDRALAVQPAFRVTDANAPAVARVCARLDGIPLALELAAAHVRVLPVEQLLGRLEDRFRLLTGGSRTALERHQTLRAAVDWSYALLDARERRLFARLSVFAGGFTLEAAEQVGAGAAPLDVLDLLTRLVDKSLVVAEEQLDGTARYRLLETLRQYAGQKLAARAGEAAAVRERHATFYLDLAKAAEPRLLEAEQEVWLHRLAQEHGNLRAALHWSVDGGASDTALRLAGALWRFWSTRGHLGEGRVWLARALDLPAGPAAARARALTAAGTLAYQQGDYAAADAHYETGLALKRELGDLPGVASSLNGLGNVAALRGEYAVARALFGESLEVRRRLHDRWGIAAALHNLGYVSHQEGDLAAARRYYEESLTAEQELGNRHGVALSLSNLGLVVAEGGDPERARMLGEESLAIFRELGDRAGAAHAFHNLGDLALDQGDLAAAGAHYTACLALWDEVGDRGGVACALEGFAGLAAAGAHAADGDRALRLAGAAATLRATLGLPLSPPERAQLERRLRPARRSLGPAAAAAWGEGRALLPAAAVAYARRAGAGSASVSVRRASRAPEADRSPPRPPTLTHRERQVVALVVLGRSNRQIARELVITERTAETHLTRIFTKLKFTARAQLAAWAATQGWRSPDPESLRGGRSPTS
jgi:predicted ATPase/class 3 adenylate cyclase/DNA-binding CsgD family transcriptional regulator